MKPPIKTNNIIILAAASAALSLETAQQAAAQLAEAGEKASAQFTLF